ATAAGYVLSVLKNLPQEGEQFTDRAGTSKSSIWTDARSTSCWSAAPIKLPPRKASGGRAPSAGNDRSRVLSVAFGGGDDGAGGGTLVHGERIGIAHSRANPRIGLAGALQRAGFDGAAGRRAAKQRIERILRRGSFGRARRTGLRRHQFE